MRMTTKLVSLLTILFVFFKFGEPTQVMMSIYGDENFLFHSDNLAMDDVVGFVYDNTNGAFAVANCTAADKTYFKLKNNCTVLSAVAVAETADGTTEAVALKAGTETGFPAADTNMMVARLETSGPIVTKTTTQLGTTATLLITITGVVGGTSTAAVPTDSTFLCNALDDTETKKLLTADTGSNAFGQVDSVATTGFPAIMKCIGAVRTTVSGNTPAENAAFATFMLIVTTHTDLTGRFSSLAFPSVVLLPKSINQTTNDSTVVGYINGKTACPSSTNFTFITSSTTATASTTPCKRAISINALGTDSLLSFIYGSATYYLPVADASGATTCPTASTTTCEDFVFNFKYSNTLIGMMLIFMLKMLQSY